MDPPAPPHAHSRCQPSLSPRVRLLGWTPAGDSASHNDSAAESESLSDSDCQWDSNSNSGLSASRPSHGDPDSAAAARAGLVCGLGSTNHQSLIRKVRGQNGDPFFVYLRHCVGESFKFYFLVQRLDPEVRLGLVGCHGHVPEDILRHDGQGKIMFQRSRRA